jgi:hypothetical protein
MEKNENSAAGNDPLLSEIHFTGPPPLLPLYPDLLPVRDGSH